MWLDDRYYFYRANKSLLDFTCRPIFLCPNTRDYPNSVSMHFVGSPLIFFCLYRLCIRRRVLTSPLLPLLATRDRPVRARRRRRRRFFYEPVITYLNVTTDTTGIQFVRRTNGQCISQVLLPYSNAINHAANRRAIRTFFLSLTSSNCCFRKKILSQYLFALDLSIDSVFIKYIFLFNCWLFKRKKLSR